jgi:glycosyltransferase involved in cell wall biosynthesis
VSDEYYEEETQPSVVLQIIRNRVLRGKESSPNLSTLAPDKPLRYLLMVSTVEPRKNHALLLAAWERLKYSVQPDLKLVIVGSPGWMHDAILKTFKPWIESGDLFHLANLPSSELRVLYKHAEATLCPSVSEGFDFSGVEAMLCGGLVISSDIPVHREVYEDASAYFNPYSAEDAATVIAEVLNRENTGMRDALRTAASEVAGRYSEARILPKWETFLDRARR